MVNTVSHTAEPVFNRCGEVEVGDVTPFDRIT